MLLLLVLKLQVVREGQTQFFGPTRLPMRMGTIVTLRDAFFKWPVRRKAANEVPTIDGLQSSPIKSRTLIFGTTAVAQIERHLDIRCFFVLESMLT